MPGDNEETDEITQQMGEIEEGYGGEAGAPKTPFEKFLRQPVHSLSPPKVVALSPKAGIGEAIETMRRHHIGAILVVDGGKVVGIFTERDLLFKIAGRSFDHAARKIEEFMTRSPECLTDRDPIAFALNKMTVGGYRHVPIVDAAGRAIGIVSMREIVDHLIDIFPRAVLNLPPTPGGAFKGLDGG